MSCRVALLAALGCAGGGLGLILLPAPSLQLLYLAGLSVAVYLLARWRQHARQRSLERLAAGLSQVAAGDYGVRLEPPSVPELEPAVAGFNAMTEALAEAQERLNPSQLRQMEHVDRLAAVGEMAAGIAHEIRNPLAGIAGAVSVLASGLAADDKRQPILREVLQQIDRLDQTVTNLLSYARPGSPEHGPCDLNELVRKTLFFVSQHPEARTIHRVEELTRDLSPAWADGKQVQQILLNLLLNAIQAMPPGGTLRVITDRVNGTAGERVRVRVCDTGPGIPADQREQVFTPFHTTKARGTGLGLAICRRLAQQNDGDVFAEAAPGGGAMLVLALPMMTIPFSSEDETP